LTRFIQSPPLWYRIIGLCIGVLVVAEVWIERGTWRGVAALPVGLAIAAGTIAPKAVGQWEQRHPYIEAFIIGAVIFSGTDVVLPGPLWICAVVGCAMAAIFLWLMAWAQAKRRQHQSAMDKA
jgi:membrane associated rhomboid family serine protease